MEWECTLPRAPLSFDGSCLTKEERYLLNRIESAILRCRTSEYGNFIR